MTIKITRWKPDTCNCIVEYSWDTSIPEESRNHTLSSIVNHCAYHQNVTDPQDLFVKVREENWKKNDVVKTLKEQFQDLRHDDISFSYDEDRTLHVLLSNLTSQDKKALHDIIKQKHSKVSIE